tara:strand:- start:118 stop:861 length:744 start_codon:yes stop_codon:yes gene_type:complete
VNILITGSDGFIGKNLFNDIINKTNHKVFPFTREHNFEDLEKVILKIDIVFHFAGINKSAENNDFEKVNVGFTKKLCSILGKSKNTSLIYASSTQAKLDNYYGRSKKKSEEICLNLEKKFRNKVYIMRLPGIFGIGCKPNYNSVVSTFCFNTANDIELKIFDPKKEIELLYVSDLNNQLISFIENIGINNHKFLEIKNKHKITIENLALLIKNFKNITNEKIFLDEKEKLEINLYKTYKSFKNKTKE